MTTPPASEPLPPAPDAEAQEEKLIGRMINRHPRLVMAALGIIMVLGILMGALLGPGFVVKTLGRVAAKLAGVQIEAPLHASESRDGGAGPALADAALRRVLRDELDRERVWTQSQVMASEARINERVDKLFMMSRGRSNTLAAGAPAATNP